MYRMDIYSSGKMNSMMLAWQMANLHCPGASAWWYETGDSGWGNHEIQNYVAGFFGTDSCAVVADGTLKIIAKKKRG